MRSGLRALVLCLVLLAAPAAALELVSVSPATVTPGAAVTVTGGPFGPQTRVVLGDRELTPARVGQRQLIFTVPPLEEGEYPLYLRDGDRASAQTAILRVTAPAPAVVSLEPANIDECSEGERRVVVRGRHFQPGATVLLDDKAVSSTRIAEDALAFTPPLLPAGIYGVQVANPDGKRSLPHSLWFNNIPEIYGVRQGEEFVNYYELVIEGRNFSLGSALVVNEYPVGFFDIPPQQRVLTVRGGGRDLTGRAPSQADNLFYVDCHTLVYNRYPYSTQLKQVVLQVVNPDGKKTSAISLSIP